MVKRKKVDKNINEKRKAGLVIIFVSVIVMIIGFFAGGIWTLTLDFGYINNNDDINGGGFNAEIIDVNDIDADNLFQSSYFNALNILSDTIAFGTTWLEVCEFGQIDVNGEVYVKTCSDKYKTTQDIVNSLKNYLSVDYIKELMGDNFIDQDGNLYIKPVLIDKNNDYIEFVSYTVKQKTSDKIIYIVKSKYGKLGCESNCQYSYSTDKFILTREENKWVVSNLEMPY